MVFTNRASKLDSGRVLVPWRIFSKVWSLVIVHCAIGWSQGLYSSELVIWKAFISIRLPKWRNCAILFYSLIFGVWTRLHILFMSSRASELYWFFSKRSTEDITLLCVLDLGLFAPGYRSFHRLGVSWREYQIRVEGENFKKGWYSKACVSVAPRISQNLQDSEHE